MIVKWVLPRQLNKWQAQTQGSAAIAVLGSDYEMTQSHRAALAKP